MQYEVAKAIRLLTPKGPLELCSGQVVLLQPERALRLVEVGKLKPLEPETADIDEYCALCSEAVRHIDADYYPRAYGWISWLKNHNPNLWKEIEEAERNLDSPIGRKITLEQFSTLINCWEALCTEAIKKYLKTQLNKMVNPVKNNPIGKLIV